MSASAFSSGKVVPVILSGGAGTRLWPLSRRLRPKQFLCLHSGETLFGATLRRVDGDAYAPALVVCNEDHRFLVAEAFREAGVEPRDIVLEPAPRNTAPAITAAAMVLADGDPGAIMLVVPSDHVIDDTVGFHAAVATAAGAAVDGHLVTFGIEPAAPETGYGYIRAGTGLDSQVGCHLVEAFVEKPDAATAAEYLASGNHLWNSGMFVFRADRLIEEMAHHCPRLVETCRRAVGSATRDLGFLRLDKASFEAAESVSVDYAVMEKTSDAVVVRTNMGWSDVGAWSALWGIGNEDSNGNVALGDVFTADTRNSYIRSDNRLVAAIGVEDLVIVATDDAVLVVPKDRAQEVRRAVDWLNEEGRDEHVSHTRVYRPWGYYQNLDQGAGFLVKQLVVKPGARLSLQYHNHRAEHWVVVEGTATITNGEEILTLSENQSVYIPKGTRHRLENAGETRLRLIEVQSGDYIGEDDIVRLEDSYGRE